MTHDKRRDHTLCMDSLCVSPRLFNPVVLSLVCVWCGGGGENEEGDRTGRRDRGACGNAGNPAV